VLRDLVRAGLVESMRGAGGGYRFSGNAKRVTLYEVVHMFEDIGGKPRQRLEGGDSSDIGRALGQVMNEIDETAVSTLKSITLATLLKLIHRNDADQAGPPSKNESVNA
jgi:Rrf2 family protein